ncbi:MAG: hypothetical protein H6716_28885 [Polyangiaceae bacterium]|nr:hypothetical protein [Polyangiaceae bacterium]
MAPLSDQARDLGRPRLLGAKIVGTATAQFLPLGSDPVISAGDDEGARPTVVVAWMSGSGVRFESVLDARPGFAANLGTVETCRGSDASNMLSTNCSTLTSWDYYCAPNTRWDLAPVLLRRNPGDDWPNWVPSSIPFRFQTMSADSRSGLLGDPTACELPMAGIEGIHSNRYYLDGGSSERDLLERRIIAQTHQGFADALAREGVQAPAFAWVPDGVVGVLTDYGRGWLPPPGECPGSLLRDPNERRGSEHLWLATYGVAGSVSVRAIPQNDPQLFMSRCVE